MHTVLRPSVPRRSKFQATVEEYDSDSSLSGSAAPSPSTNSGAGAGAGAAADEDGRLMPDGHGSLPVKPVSSKHCSPRRRQRPSVHFSTRHPVVLHHRTDSTSSSSSSSLSSSNSSSSAPSSSSSSTSSKRVSSRDVGALGQETPFSSVVDRQWGVLFTEKGEPTTRLGEVLRGVANYIIREYKPSASLITPGKLSAFYRRYRLEKEPFPLDALFEFDSRQALRNLELLYQDLSCEYHLIPDHHHHHHHHHHHRTGPSIPALTPTGLQTWLALLIQASPSCESHRLSQLLLDVPLEADTSSSSSSSSSSSATPERLPAQLSRSLLPAHRNEKVYTVIASALDGWYERARSFHPREMPVPVASPPSWSTIICDALGGGVSSSSSSSSSSSAFSQQHKIKRLPAPQDSHPEKRNHRDVCPRRHESIILPSGYDAGAGRPRPKHHGKFATFTHDQRAEERVSDGKGTRAREVRTQPQPTRDSEPWSSSSSSRRAPYADERTHRVHVKAQGRYSHREDPRTETYRTFLRGRVRV
ncbi:hypothetical protein E4U21_006742 [Claviceps maximensis]|nr:hypothetical protein E4U21_006742 [Claviceps maximensis]